MQIYFLFLSFPTVSSSPSASLFMRQFIATVAPDCATVTVPFCPGAKRSSGSRVGSRRDAGLQNDCLAFLFECDGFFLCALPGSRGGARGGALSGVVVDRVGVVPQVKVRSAAALETRKALSLFKILLLLLLLLLFLRRLLLPSLAVGEHRVLLAAP